VESGPDAHVLAGLLLDAVSMQDSYADWMARPAGAERPMPVIGHTPGMRIVSGRRVSEVDVG
jgi:hypothetical protein